MHDPDLIAGASSHDYAQYKTNEVEIIVKMLLGTIQRLNLKKVESMTRIS